MKKWIVLMMLAGLLFPANVFAAASITFVGATSDTTDSATYTYTNHAIGTASADRCVVVEIFGRRAAATDTTVTATIGGNAATIVKQHSWEEAGAASVVAVATLLVTSGTTATIALTFSGSMVRSRVAVSTLTGTSDCTTLADSDESDANAPTANLDVPANGSAVASCMWVHGTSTTTWTGITERHDANVETSIGVSGASDNFASQQVGLTMTCTPANTTSGETGIFVSWGPSGGGGGSTGGRRIAGGGLF